MERVPEALRKEIGNRLRQLRKEKGLTLSEASEKAGLAKSTYGGFESGFRAPSINSLRKLAKSLNVSSDFLLFGYSEELDLAILLNRSDLNFSGARLSFEERKKIKEYIEFLLSKRDGDD
jgi:transcriptional regulator with XRE-family HTH domain